MGSTQYSANTWKRPQLVYVGADDGMLHAFFGHAGTRPWLETYQGGEEAFAFIPNDMLPVITKLYAQGGQKLAVDKSEHIFGLAASPKVKDMCIGSAAPPPPAPIGTPSLVMPEGPGGNKPFALDITNVIDETNGLRPSR
jgi:type IV pilus assembly protein PilY1